MIKVKFKSQLCTQGASAGQIVYTTQQKHAGRIDEKALAEELEQHGTASRADALAVLYSIRAVIPRLLLRGHTIELAGLGTFSLQTRSDAVLAPEEFSVSKNMRPPRVSFRPTRDLLRELADGVSYQLERGYDGEG